MARQPEAIREWLKPIAKRALGVHLPASGPARLAFRMLYACHVGARDAAIQLLRFGWYEPLFRSRCAAVGSRFRMEQLPYLTGSGRIVIGDDVVFSGKSAITFFRRLGAPEPELHVGDGTFIGHDCSLAVASSVSIGRRCLVAGGVRIHDFDGHPVDAARRRAGEATPPEGIKPILVEDDAWIGSGARILKGVTIGARSIVGAGAVVTKDVAPDVIVAGNPARVVKRIVPNDAPARDRSEPHRPVVDDPSALS